MPLNSRPANQGASETNEEDDMTKAAAVCLLAMIGASVSISTSATTSTGWVRFNDGLPPAGSGGKAAIPTGAGLEDTSHPDHVIGNGTAASCTSAAVVKA